MTQPDPRTEAGRAMLREWAGYIDFGEPELREAILAIETEAGLRHRDDISEAAPTRCRDCDEPWPCSYARDFGHTPASEAAPVVGLDVEALRRAMVEHWPGSPSHCNLDCARDVAATYARLTQTRTLGEEK